MYQSTTSSTGEFTTNNGTTTVTVYNEQKQPDTISIELEKTWNMSDSEIPEQLYIELLSAAPGTAADDITKWDVVTVNGTTYHRFDIAGSASKVGNVWKYTFSNLPKNKDYMILEYTKDGKSLILTAGDTEATGALFDQTVKAEYLQNVVTTTQQGTEDNKFKILNVETGAMPKTGGEGIRFFVIFGAGTILLAGGALFLLKRKTMMQSANGGEQ